MANNATRTSHSDGPRAFPIAQGFERLGIGAVKGHALINSGELETYTVGRRRYVTEEALQRFIENRVLESLNESRAERAARVKKAVEGRARRRDEQLAA